MRTQQVAYDRQESSIGVHCVAAPIHDVTGQVIAAMSIGVPTDRWSEARMAELTDLIQHSATQLSQALGWHDTSTGALTQHGITTRLRSV